MLKAVEFKYNLRQIITAPTRQTHNSKSLIDLIFTTVPAELVTASGVDQQTIISDHLSVYIIKKKLLEHHPKKQIRVHKKIKYDTDYFRNLILDDPGWKLFWCDTGTVNEKWGIVVEIITRCLNILCPIKVITIRQVQPDWFDGELRSAIDKKAKLFKQACTGKYENDWMLYTKLRKQVRTLTIKKKRHYYKLQETQSKTIYFLAG